MAVLIDHIESDYHTEIIRGVLRAARSAPVRTLVVPGGALGLPGQPLARNFIYDLLPKANLDGVLVLGGSLSNSSGLAPLREFAGRLAPTPCVVIGLDLPDLATVRVDNEVGVHSLVSHLIEHHNRRRIAFIRGPVHSAEAEARRIAYLQALRDHQIHEDDRLIVEGGLGREDGASGAGRLFDERRFTVATLNALVAVNDDVALGALDELTRRGIAVPDQVSLVGFDDADSASIANPPMTTVNQRVEVQSYTGMRTLLDALESRGPPSSVILQPELVIRASCGCKRQVHSQSDGTRPSRVTLARSCRLALVERRGAISAELSRAGAGRIAGVPGWESRLLDALERSLVTSDGAHFGDEVERLGRRQFALGHGAMACHDVLSALRIAVLACTWVEPDIRPRVEDIFHESRLSLARSAAYAEQDRQRVIKHRLRAVTRACLSLIRGGKVSDLTQALEEHLPALGIAAFMLSRFRDGSRLDELEVLARHSSLKQSGAGRFISSEELGLDSAFEQELAIVIEPLDCEGQPVGIAAFAWGAHEPVQYEQLRELLGAAIGALRA